MRHILHYRFFNQIQKFCYIYVRQEMLSKHHAADFLNDILEVFNHVVNTLKDKP